MTSRSTRLALTVGLCALAWGCVSPVAKLSPKVVTEGRVGTIAPVAVGTLTGVLLGPKPGVIADNAASVLSNAAGGLIANNGGGLVSNGGGNYRLAALADLASPVADAEVTVVDTDGKPLAAAPVKTSADGRYTLSGLKAARGVVFVKATYQAEGQTVTLIAAAPAQGAPQDVAVDPATTLVAKNTLQALSAGKLKPEAVRPRALADSAAAIARSMSAKAVAAAAILPAEKAAVAFDAMLAESKPLAQAVEEAETKAAEPSSAPTAGPSPSRAPGASAVPASAPPASAVPSSEATTAASQAPASVAPSAAIAPAPSLLGAVTTFAGSGVDGDANGAASSAQFAGPSGLAFDLQGNLLVADVDNQAIRKVTPQGVVSTLAGGGVLSKLQEPFGIAVDAAGTVFVTDADENCIWKITAEGGIKPYAGTTDGDLVDGALSSAAFDTPRGVAFDHSGNMIVADTGNHGVRKITPAGVVSTLAGGGLAGSTDGTGAAARFSQPWGVAVDAADNVYVTDRLAGTLRKVTPQGVVTTVASGMTYPAGVAIDRSGALYVTEELGYRIRRWVPGGALQAVAGSGGPGFADGNGAAAKFKAPSGLAFDAAGRLYVADTNNDRVRRIE